MCFIKRSKFVNNYLLAIVHYKHKVLIAILKYYYKICKIMVFTVQYFDK